MAKYKFDWLNNGVEITNPQIKMNGHAGAPLNNDVSPGGFFVDLELTFGSPNNVKVGVRITGTTQPENITSVESIKEWAIAELNAQYGVE